MAAIAAPSRAGGEADMLVAEGEPQAGMPRRRTDHRRLSGSVGRDPRQVSPTARQNSTTSRAHRLHRIDLGKGRGRVAVGQFDTGGHANALLHRGHQKTAIGIMGSTLQ